MVHMLELPVHLLEATFSFLCVANLKSLSLSNKTLHKIVRKALWRNVKIYWNSLLEIQWDNPITLGRLENLKFTRSVQFLDPDDFFPRIPGSYPDTFPTLLGGKSRGRIEKIHVNYRRILHHLVNVDKFQSSRGGVILVYACQMLEKLKDLDVSCVGDLGSKWDKKSTHPLHKIGQLEHLVKLDASQTGVHTDPCQVEVLRGQGLRKLECLILSDIDFSEDESLACIATLPKLKQLRLMSTSMTDAQLGEISKSSSLEAIDMSFSHYITDAGIKELLHLEYLVALSVASSGRITDEGFKYISLLPRLKKLVLNSTDVSDAAMTLICRMGALHELGVAGCKNLTANCVGYFKDMKNLKVLDFRGNDQDFRGIDQIDKDSLLALRDFSSIEQLYTEGRWCVRTSVISIIGDN